METMILALIGIAALGYVARLAYQSIRGKSTCNCGGDSSCGNKSGSCCGGSQHGKS